MRLIGAFCLCSVLLLGCAKPSKWDRIPLRGMVTLDGKPFNGSINVRPTSGVTGPTASATVARGRFEFDRSTGPVAGMHQALLMLPSTGGSRLESQLQQTLDVPMEEPFDVTIEFEMPEDPIYVGQSTPATSEETGEK